MRDEIVVTGLGMWTPYGRGAGAFWQGLMSGRPALRHVDRFDCGHKGYRSNLAASIPGMGCEASGETEAVAATMIETVLADTMADAAVEPGDLPAYDVALVLGVTQGLPVQFRASRVSTARQALCRIGSGAILSKLAARIGAQGYVGSVSTACASGTQSIGVAYGLLESGRARRVFAGGFGYFSEASFSGFNIFRLLSKSGCRPFDAERDGVILGDGFVLTVLEKQELARSRSAHIYGRVLGYASGNEAFHATAPDPTGKSAYETMLRCFEGKTEYLEQLDYVNAHGTGTMANDPAELAAISRLAAHRSSKRAIAVSSTKGHHGHALGAAGSIEFAATLLAIVHQTVPPTCGLAEPAAVYDEIELIRGLPSQRTVRLALSNSFAFGGNLASLVVGAP
ncbi:MAG TPA: beta-ketoacyl-[acyl-carrier-protein] synthase family protein [Bryobacteraceae bacterium]|nr:beta-ketoacyl-[acyl-carrier-protein] synthase family protein [Bryobacteraceae bacterium]